MLMLLNYNRIRRQEMQTHSTIRMNTGAISQVMYWSPKERTGRVLFTLFPCLCRGSSGSIKDLLLIRWHLSCKTEHNQTTLWKAVPISDKEECFSSLIFLSGGRGRAISWLLGNPGLPNGNGYWCSWA